MPRALTLAVALLCLTSLLPAKWSARITGLPRAMVGFITVPLLDLASRPVERADPQAALAATSSADALRYTRHLELRLVEAQRLIAQLTAVRELIGESPVRLIHARVIAVTGPRHQPLLRVNRGSGAGLLPGDVVSDGVQVVGRVAAVDAVSATVKPVTAAGQELLVRFAPGDAGRPAHDIVALAQASEGGSYLVAVVGKDQPLAVGDAVHLDDPAWPRAAWGLLVGRVIGIDDLPTDPTLRSRVFIEPLTPPDRRGDVVIWSAPAD